MYTRSHAVSNSGISNFQINFKDLYKRGLLRLALVLHKIQDFQESCLGLVLKARQDQDKTVILKIKTRQD